MRRLTRTPLATTAAALAIVLTAAACTTAEDDGAADDSGTTDEATDGGTGDGASNAASFTYAFEQEFQSYNPNTAEQNSSLNVIPLNRVLLGFWNYAPDGTIGATPEFGSYEVVSEDPLTLTYTIDDEAVWSDGEPIDCDDFQLAYIAKAGLESGETDPETGEAATLFSPSTTAGYDQIESVECADGDKEITVTYDEPFVDFEALFGTTEILPAHIVEEQAGIDDIIPLIEARDAEALAPASDFWINGWVFTPGDLDPALIPSSGPYQLDSWDVGQSLTLTANPNWWGEPPATDTVVIRFIPQEQQAQALQNGELQAMDPQPNPELVAQLEGIGDSIVFETADQFTWEHLDLNFDTVFADPLVREAFALCVPRQLIVDNLIVPQNPEAEILNARYFLPFQPQYTDATASGAGAAYDEVDLERSAGLLAEAGVETPLPVRIGYQSPNQRRTDVVALVRDSCAEAGFEIVDEGSEEFFGTVLPASDFDVALFAWAGSALLSGQSGNYITGGDSNFNNYSNAEVDDLTAQLNRSTDQEAAADLATQIDDILWEDIATIPLFAFPGVLAYDADAQGVEYNASQAGLTWNADRWSVAAQ